MGKHSAQTRSPLPVILGTVAVVAVAVAAFLAFRAFSGSTSAAGLVSATDTSSASTTSASATTSASPSVSPSASAAATTSAADAAADAAARAALQGCVARQEAAKPLVAAATQGAKHWSDHVQGETDIESGARSLIDVKANTWGPTRAAGPGDVAAYQTAMSGYAAVGGCDNIGSLPASGDLTGKVQACAAHQQALDAYVEAAKAVMQDWQTHISEMADHADGHINSAQAQANWLKRYREAPAHLTPFNAAAGTLSAAPACTV